MKFTIQRDHIQKAIEKRNGYMMLALANSVLCFLLIIIIFLLIGREKIIVVPPNIEKTFWVSSHQVSPEYLSEMATFFTELRFNVDSDNVNYQQEMLLRYTDPTYYGQLKTLLVQESDKIKDEHIATSFYPVNVKVDVNNFQTLVEGDFKSYIGDMALPIKRVKYLLTFRYDAGRLMVKSFDEVKNA